MAEAAQPIIQTTTLNRSFEGYNSTVSAVAVFPDGCRMVMSSHDGTLLLWDLKCSVMWKKMQGHGSMVSTVAISRNGPLIASGDLDGKLIVWHGDTGESLTQAIDAHPKFIYSLDFSPDGTVLATGSDNMTKLWNTKTWQAHGNSIIGDGRSADCVRYSPSGELALAITAYTTVSEYGTHIRGHASQN